MEPLGNSATGAYQRMVERLGHPELAPAPAENQASPPSDSPPTEATDPRAPVLPDSLEWQRRRYMLDLPPTTILQADLERALALAKRSARAAEVYERDIRFATYRLELGDQRDQIDAARPEGCWCLGLGGRDELAVPILDGDGPARFFWRKHCTCTEGEMAAQALADAQASYQIQARAHRLQRLFSQAALQDYTLARLETMQVEPINQAAHRICLEWADPTNERADGSLYIAGDVGTGKTFEAVALLRRRVELGKVGLFVTTEDLLQQIRDTYDADAQASTAAVIGAAKTVDVLVLDDIGSEHVTGWVLRQLTTVINARATACLPTIFTSNIAIEDLPEILDERIASRISGMCGGIKGSIVRWGGPDKRLNRKQDRGKVYA